MKSLKANITDLFEKSNFTLFTLIQDEKRYGVTKDFELELLYKKMLWERYNE